MYKDKFVSHGKYRGNIGYDDLKTTKILELQTKTRIFVTITLRHKLVIHTFVLRFQL